MPASIKTESKNLELNVTNAESLLEAYLAKTELFTMPNLSELLLIAEFFKSLRPNQALAAYNRAAEILYGNEGVWQTHGDKHHIPQLIMQLMNDNLDLIEHPLGISALNHISSIEKINFCQRANSSFALLLLDQVSLKAPQLPVENELDKLQEKIQNQKSDPALLIQLRIIKANTVILREKHNLPAQEDHKSRKGPSLNRIA